jgi:HK97 family phage major capsid protein
MTIKTAYSLLRVKQVDEEMRQVEGIATTPTPDRMNDVVDPMGATFAAEIPLHLYHNDTKPIGHVKLGRPTKKGIPFKAWLPLVTEPGVVKDRVDEAWHSLKYRLLGAVSIGFKVINDAVEYMENGGINFLQTEILELSLVSIPAQPDAVITGIKSIDDQLRAASGPRQRGVVTIHKSAGVAASSVHKGREAKQMNLQENISQFEAKRVASAARMEAIMKAAGDEGRTLNEAEEEEYDGLAKEVETVDAHLVRLRRAESVAAGKAQRVVVPADSADQQAAADTARSGSVISVDRKLEKGVEFARYAMCVGAAKGNLMQAHEIAKTRFKDTPRLAIVLKAAVAAGTTVDATWAAPLLEYNQFAGDFVEFLRPMTILGKFGNNGIPSLRRVPFNINIRGQTSGGEGYWVGQGAPKPLTKFDFENIYLGFAKVANIAVLTEELLRFSNPSAELLVRDSLAAALIERLDIDFVDPAKALVANVSPASITNGVTGIPASGTGDAADIRADVKAAMSAYIAANISPTSAVWIMPATTALSLSLMVNPLGQPEFPGVSMNGGTFGGIPVIVSEHVPTVSAGALVILANAQDIWLADDGGVTLSASTEASLQMLDNPTNNSATGTATTMVSMFQTNSVALRAERYINWKKRRAQAVQVIEDANWGA